MSQSLSKSSHVDIALAVGTFSLLLLLFFPTLKEIALICWNDDDYSHGLLLPIVAGFMLWDRRASIVPRLIRASSPDLPVEKKKKENSVLLAELLVLVGMFIFFLGAASGISYASWIAFFPTTLGIVHLVFGRTAALTLAPPILLLFMAKPLPDSLVVRIFWPLQVFAAKVSAFVLEVLNVPVYLSGNIIEIPSMRLLVEEACSGMRSVMALLTLAFIVSYFIDLRKFSKVLLVLSALLVAIVMNVFRVALTGVLAHFYDPKTATGFFHTFSGLIVFIVGLPILYFIGCLLLKWDSRGKNTPADA